MRIQTNRLTIRPFNQDDYEDLFEIYSNEEVCRYLLYYPWTLDNKDRFNTKLKNTHLDKNTTLSLAIQMDKKVIGDIHIWYTGMKNCVEIGYVFNPLFHHKGYATEAVRAVIEELFKTYNVHRIQANLDARNITSAKLCEHVGMRQEAHFIQDYWNKGEWTDSYIYAMLESDL